MILVKGFMFLILFICKISAQNFGPRAVPSLKFLVMISKHGARAPTHTYPRDPYRDKSWWPDRPGLITKIGKQQMYIIGEDLRRLYNGYLSEYYQNSRVLVQATMIDRTLISASTLLAGLFPPKGHQQWHSIIDWQPVPIYPNLLDKSLIALDPSHCPRYWQEQNNSLQELSLRNNQYGDLYHAVSEGSGRNMSSCAQLYLLCQNLAAVTENSLPLPNWAERIFLPRLLPIVSQMVRDSTLKNVKMIKILNGLFLKKIIDLFQWRTQLQKNKEQEELSLYMHVGHDITIMCLLAALGFQNFNIPWSSTTLLFELHENLNLPSKHEVQVLKICGKNSSDSPEPLDLPNCKSPCDFTTFTVQVDKYTTNNWQQECLNMDSSSDS